MDACEFFLRFSFFFFFWSPFLLGNPAQPLGGILVAISKVWVGQTIESSSRLSSLIRAAPEESSQNQSLHSSYEITAHTTLTNPPACILVGNRLLHAVLRIPHLIISQALHCLLGWFPCRRHKPLLCAATQTGMPKKRHHNYLKSSEVLALSASGSKGELYSTPMGTHWSSMER